MTKQKDTEPEDVVVSMDASTRTGKRAKAKTQAMDVDDIVDALLGGELEHKTKSTKRKSSKKGKQSKDVEADDIVEAMLGGELETMTKKTKKRSKRKSAKPAESESDHGVSDGDDVADLYAWDAPEEAPAVSTDESRGEEADAERRRTLQLALAAAEDSERAAGPRDTDELFSELNREPAQRVRVDEEHELAAVRERHVPREKRESVGRYVAIDCEMVGVGFKGSRSMLARVAVVNYYGHELLDAYVRPTEPVTDYRTWVSGIRKQDIEHARPFDEVQAEVAALLKDRVLVGHALKNDLGALMLTHPPLLTRDTLRFPGFRSKGSKTSPSLRKLAASVLNITIQEGEHSPVVDAKTSMLLYRNVKTEWEQMLAPRRYKAQVVKAKTKERFARLRQEIKDQQQQQNQ
ncbi:3'-5' exonuclease [Coemansia sp. RSA 2618]|nr:3'-5' exonuclease [Coemansia sp. RSA 2618]